MALMSSFLKLVCLFPVVTHGLQAFKHEEETNRPSVWIVGMMRAGSSTILSMMSSTIDGNQDGGEVFSSFEPCAKGDEYAGQLTELTKQQTSDEVNSRLCGALVLGMSKCDFSEIVGLRNWQNPHSTNGNTTTFTRSTAEALCKKSQLVAVKTVTGMRLENVTWALDRNPNLKIIQVIRDPRAMYASHLKSNGVPAGEMDKLCRMLAMNVDVEDPRIYRVLFEDLVTDPLNVSKGIFKFLGRQWGTAQDDWLRGTFNSDCETKQGRYNDCHSDSAAVATAWKKELSTSQKEEFSQNEDCKKVASAYGYE